MKAYPALLVGGEEHGKFYAMPGRQTEIVTARLPFRIKDLVTGEPLEPVEHERVIYTQKIISVFGYSLPVYVQSGLSERAMNLALADLLLSEDGKRVLREWA